MYSSTQPFTDSYTNKERFSYRTFNNELSDREFQTIFNCWTQMEKKLIVNEAISYVLTGNTLCF